MSPIRLRSRLLLSSTSVLALLALMLIVVTPSGAALPSGKPLRPEAIAPVDGATLDESGLRFAWRQAFSGARHSLLVSHQPFDPSGWTRLPSDPAIEVHSVARPLVTLSDLGIKLEASTRLYWAAASIDAGTGRVVFSDVRSFNVLPKFSNRIEPSPYLRQLPISMASPEAGDPSTYRIRLTAGYTIDPRLGEPVLPENLRNDLETDAQPQRAFLVYYGNENPETVRERILASGGSVVSYVADHAFLVRSSSPQFSVEADWMGVYQPAYKLSPRIDVSAPGAKTVNVLVFNDGSIDAVSSAIQMSGGRVVTSSSNGINKLLRVSANASLVTALAQHPDVAWIEPYVQPVLDNVNAQWTVQTNLNNNRRIWDAGIQGQGQVVNTSDSGIDMTHDQFEDGAVPVTDFGDYPTHRKVIGYKLGSINPGVAFGDHAGASHHGSHTAGTFVGNDTTQGISLFDGVAKHAKIYFMDISGTDLANGVDPFPDLNDLWQPAYDGNIGGAARISSNSWGAPVNGLYDLNALNLDQFTWNHKDFLICFSNGNGGPGAGTVGSPATAKNSVGVGGTGNGLTSGSVYASTSRGPTNDGRRKPTVASPAVNLSSAGPGPSVYQTLTGTSMASPNTAGAAALVRQYLMEGWYPTGAKVPANGFTPSAALLKAILVNTASNNGVTGQTAPSNAVGWGRVCLDSALFFVGDTRRLLLVDQTDGLGHQQQIEFQVNVTDNTLPLEVSLVWTDYPGNPAITTQIVNDLDLVVTNGVVTYRGNNFTTGVSNTSATVDHVNVEECVRVVTGHTAGIWTVRVTGFSIPAGPQPFGLVITGGIGTTAGTLALDRASYGSASTVDIQVTDTNAGGSVTVNLTSPTEPGGESVVIAGANGVYQGSIPLSPFEGTGGDGTLQVSSGDQITATYNDASPVAALTAKATVSFNPPIITNVLATNQGDGNVLVSWKTDENASSKVYYGTTPALGSETTIDPLATLNHSAMVSGLDVGQTYYYDVESQDLDGNVTRDDYGGVHYKFTVSPSGDILLVIGDATFDRGARYTNALNRFGWTFDTWNSVLADNPPLGDLSSGLRRYAAVWWQVGMEQYPPFTDDARPVLTDYLDGGGRLCVVGNDIVWALGDNISAPPNNSPYYTADRNDWLNNTLHTQFVADPTGWTNVRGVAADPISEAYTGSIPYTEHRAGASGDEINTLAGTGTVSTSWMSGDASPDDAGLRWESGGPQGTAGTGYWGGQNSRLAAMYFEWSGINTSSATDTVRARILDKTLIWLMGRERPLVAITSPNGGEILTADSQDITWTEATSGGTNVASRTIEYSLDGGQSWTTLTTSAGASPYSWDLTTVPNSPSALVRIKETDDGTPAFSNSDASNATFSIQRAGGDVQGPAVVAGSVRVNPNPVSNQVNATLTATISDSLSGGSIVAAAEWSYGDAPAPAGTGAPMTGGFATRTVNVTAVMNTQPFNPGSHNLYVRGQDAAGNWGNAAALPVVVNGPVPLSVGAAPKVFELRQNIPNPVSKNTLITFSLPAASPVSLVVFDIQGRQIKQLVSETKAPGVYDIRWNRDDDAGRPVGPGLYYYRLVAGQNKFERRMVAIQ